MNNNYEQEFVEKVSVANQPAPSNWQAPSSTGPKSSLLLVVVIIFAIIVLVESVALIIFATNYGEVLDLYGDGDIEYPDDLTGDYSDELSSNSNFDYDDNFDVTSFNLTCTNEDDFEYAFTKSGTYQKTDSASNTIDSGTYSIINGGAVVLDSANQSEDKVVYYDGYVVMDGIDSYMCDDE